MSARTPLGDQAYNHTDVSLMASSPRRRFRFRLRTLLVFPVVLAALIALNTQANYPPWKLDPDKWVTVSVPGAIYETRYYGWPWTCVTWNPAVASQVRLGHEVDLLPLLGNLLVAFAMCGAPIVLPRWLPHSRATRHIRNQSGRGDKRMGIPPG